MVLSDRDAENEGMGPQYTSHFAAPYGREQLKERAFLLPVNRSVHQLGCPHHPKVQRIGHNFRVVSTFLNGLNALVKAA
jgi:hypothetical protein